MIAEQTRLGPAAALRDVGRLVVDERILASETIGLPQSIAAHPCLSLDAKAVAGGLLTFANRKRGDGCVWPSHAKLSHALGGVGRRTLQRALEELQRHGFLTIEPLNGRSNTYRLHAEPRPHDCRKYSSLELEQMSGAAARPARRKPQETPDPAFLAPEPAPNRHDTCAEPAHPPCRIGMTPMPIRHDMEATRREASERKPEKEAARARASSALQDALPGTGVAPTIVDRRGRVPKLDPRELDPGAMPAEMIWWAALEDLGRTLSPGHFETWVKNARALKAPAGSFRLVAPNAFAREWLDLRLRDQVETAIAGVIGARPRLEVLVARPGAIDDS